MSIDIMQSEIGGVYGLVLPFYELPLEESNSFGFRLDSYACGNELITASVYVNETDVSSESNNITCFAY